MMVNGHDGLADWARDAFGFEDEDVSIRLGARGAQGQVWKLAVGGRAYALKRVFAGRPPAPSTIEAEVAFTQLATAAGVRLPASHPDRNGRYLVPLPDDGWVRLFDWVELRTADLAGTAESVGLVLARLHQCGRATDRELDGGAASPWYTVPPAPDSWAPLVAAALEADYSWAIPLAVAVEGLPPLYAVVSPAVPATMRLCHRDLHPGNLLADDAGDLVIVDWDSLGPADPAGEIAFTLMACFHDGEPDLVSMRRTYTSYLDGGGPARLRSLEDFTMSIAASLNFFQRQLRVALDPTASSRDRTWAELEIDEWLRIRPSPDLLTTVLDAL